MQFRSAQEEILMMKRGLALSFHSSTATNGGASRVK
jgi:hypothetical protein